jgi:hypothetical protein
MVGAPAVCGYGPSVLVGIDHVLVAVADPDVAAASLSRQLSLEVGGGGRHDAHGTYNKLFWLGDSYIELMGVFDEGLAATSWWGRHCLDVISRGGGYMGIAIATNDIAADGVGFGAPPEPGRRVRPDGHVVRWQLAHPDHADADLGLVFLIEHDETGAEWSPADRAARAASAQGSLMRVELPVISIPTATMRLLRDMRLQFRPSLAGGGARDASIGAQTLRLMASRGAAVPKVVMRTPGERRAVKSLGVEFVIEPAISG